MKAMLGRIAAFMAVPADNPELLKEQFLVLSRMVPLLYFILVANAWMLTTTFLDKAPIWLNAYVALALSVVCCIRLVQWWRRKKMVLSDSQLVHELKRTNKVAAVLGISFSAWALALFPYGDAFGQAHIVFFVTVSMLGSMLCLIHLRSASLIVAATVGIPTIGFFVSSGVPVLMAMSVNAMLLTLAGVVVVVVQYRDFTRMVDARTESRLRLQEQSRLFRMIDDMPIAVMTVEPETLKINYVNQTSRDLIRRIEHLLPLNVDDLLGTSIDIFHRDPGHQRRILADPANLPHSARIRLGPEMLDIKISAITDDDGGYMGPMLTWALVTKEVEAENRIRQLAHYDTLTGLPNRVTFSEEMEGRLAASGSRTALLFIDLDGFKLVNDTRGHRVGDALLGQVAARLRAACEGLATTIGRLGGDEFAVVLPHDDAQEAMALGDRIVQALGAPYDLDYDRSVRIGASIGIAFSPAHGADGDTLLARADMALYAAKAAGKGQARIFSEEMETRIHERVRLEGQLRAALEHRDRLFVFYQPIVDIETGKVTAREALVRWHHDERGWISPGEFVPVAEECGLIEPLGEFVLDRACRDAVTWADGARVAVNISASQLGKGTLAPAVLAALVRSGLSPDRLEIEVTETALLDDGADVLGDLRRLHDMGVKLALDDFGTGYSSLAHLRTFPFDKIKIDGSFVRDAVERTDCAAVVKAIAIIGKRLGVTTVAEGVETQEHFDCVRAEGCKEVQGYLCGRPQPSERDVPLIEALSTAASKAAHA